MPVALFDSLAETFHHHSEVDKPGETGLHDLSYEEAVREVPGDIALGPAELEGVYPRVDLVEVFFVQCDGWVHLRTPSR